MQTPNELEKRSWLFGLSQEISVNSYHHNMKHGHHEQLTPYYAMNYTLQNKKDAYWRRVNASWRRMNASRRKMSI